VWKETIATCVYDYVSKAIDFGTKPWKSAFLSVKKEVKKIAKKNRQGVAEISTVFDVSKFVAGLEKGLEAAWSQYLAGKPFSNIEV